MPHRKKIIVLTSTGGGGHIAATNALMEYFGHQYHIQPIFPLKTFLSPTDITLALTFGRWDGEFTYNFFVRKGYYRIINLFAKFGCRYFIHMHKRCAMRMQTFLMEQEPDLVISLIPLINSITLDACKELNIPFLLAPTDFNPKLYLCNFNKPAFEKFILTLPFENRKIREIIKPAHVPDSQTHVTGCLIRPQFFSQKNKQEIRASFDVPENKSTLMLLMGAQGADYLLIFVQELCKITTPIHLLICIGRNKDLEPVIRGLPFPKHTSYSIIGYTDQIANLMAIADLLITKPGPNSIAEALYSGVPLLVDATRSVLSWEQFNVDFVQDHGFGKIITKLETIAPMADELLVNKEEYDAIKQRIAMLPKKNGLEEIGEIIEALI